MLRSRRSSHSAGLEQAIYRDLCQLQFPSSELAAWFRSTLHDAVDDLTSYQREQRARLAKRKSELATMQDRLLNAYLSGTVEELIYQAKSAELKAETLALEAQLAKLAHAAPGSKALALGLFDWSQGAAELWLGSNTRVRREMLDVICLNRTLGDVSLVTTKRKPFDLLAKGLNFNDSRGDRIFTKPTITFTAEEFLAA